VVFKKAVRNWDFTQSKQSVYCYRGYIHSFIFLLLPSLGAQGICEMFFFHFSFLILQTVGRTSWTGDHPVARQLPTQRTIQTQNKCRQTSMPWVGFQPTSPVFQWAKTDHVLDRTATVNGVVVDSILVKCSIYADIYVSISVLVYDNRITTLNVRQIFKSQT
jgi:hypothetical protein